MTPAHRRPWTALAVVVFVVGGHDGAGLLWGPGIPPSGTTRPAL